MDANEAGRAEGSLPADDILRQLEPCKRRLEGNPFESLPLHRLLAYGRDHGPETPGLAEAVGERLADDLLEDGLSGEQQLAALRTVGERVLADRRLLVLAPWPELDSTLAGGPDPGYLSDMKALRERLAAGLPLARRIQQLDASPDEAPVWRVEISRDEAAREVVRRVVEAHRRLEAKFRPLWTLPQDTPPYLQPREEMGGGQALADPVLRDLVEGAWDAMVMLHRTVKANSHPASREDDRGRWEDDAIDSNRVEAIRFKVGERLLASGGVAAPLGLPPASREEFLQKLGGVLVEVCYGRGTDRIKGFEALWAARDWSALVTQDYLSRDEGEELKLWTARDYRGLLARGAIDAGTCEWYEEMDALGHG